jgi:hypothetical protein
MSPGNLLASGGVTFARIGSQARPVSEFLGASFAELYFCTHLADSFARSAFGSTSVARAHRLGLSRSFYALFAERYFCTHLADSFARSAFGSTSVARPPKLGLSYGSISTPGLRIALGSKTFFAARNAAAKPSGR